MNELNVFGNNEILTMSSREIAELTGKRHDHILRDIRTMLVSLYGDEAVKGGAPEVDAMEVFFNKLGMGIDSPKLGDQRVAGIKLKRDGRGYVAQIGLDYSHTMTLISGYNVKLRKAIIDHWQALEARPAIDPMQILSDPAAMRGLLLTYTEKVLTLEHKVEELAPKAEALDRISLADGEVCLQTAGKLLQQPPNKFIAWLRSLGTWIFKRQGSKRNSAYTDKINAGYLNVRTVTTIMPDGSERVTEQVVVTPKGLVKLAQMLGVAA
jgi:phage antirepressor YoqD-like protein